MRGSRPTNGRTRARMTRVVIYTAGPAGVRVSMRVVAILACLWLSLLAAAPAGAAALDFPDLDLSSSPESVRAWAESHGFRSIAPTPPYDEAFELETTDGTSVRHVLSFVTDSRGLKMLSFEQYGILTAPSILRRDIVRRYGEPSADQIVGGTTLRITFPLPHTEPARRIFLIGSQQLSMLLVTDDFFAELQGETARQEQAEEAAKERAAETARQADIEARNAWLVPLAWAAGIALGGFVLIQILPPTLRRPVVGVLGWAFGGLIEFGVGVFDQLFRVMLGIVTFGMMIVAGLAVGAGAVEWGTSWWWSLLWLSGFATLLKHDSVEGIGMRGALLALGLFVAATAGVFIQQFWPVF